MSGSCCAKVAKTSDAPSYDFAIHTRQKFEELQPADVLILEGTLLLTQPQIKQLLDS